MADGQARNASQLPVLDPAADVDHVLAARGDGLHRVPFGEFADRAALAIGETYFDEQIEEVRAARTDVATKAGQAATSAAVSASAASTATTRRDQAQVARNETTTALGSALAARDAALGHRNAAAANAQAAANSAAGVNLPAVSSADAGKVLAVKSDGSGYEPKAPTVPLIKPVSLVSPAAGAGNIGAGGTYEFVARAFPGDTQGFYSVYGIPVASRFVRAYEPGAVGPVQTFSAPGGGSSLSVDFIASSLQTSHAYEWAFGYVDAEGNVGEGPRVSAITAARFKPAFGAPYKDGRMAFDNFGNGPLSDLVVAPKSTEINRPWASSSTLLGALSRVDGKRNTDRIIAGDTASTSYAAGYARSVMFGAEAGFLASADQMRAIASVLKPSVATHPDFQAGGSEAFTNATIHWSSTEDAAGTALRADMVGGTNFSAGAKTENRPVRAIRSIPVTPPYPIGTQMQGGRLGAYYTDLSSGSPATYMLIRADKATEASRAWDNQGGPAAGYTSRTNGELMTIAVGSSTRFLASSHCAELVSGGWDNWYLAGVDEFLCIALMDAGLPAEQRLEAGAYWTATEVDAATAKLVTVSTLTESAGDKTQANLVLPIRRVRIFA